MKDLIIYALTMMIFVGLLSLLNYAEHLPPSAWAYILHYIRQVLP